MKKSLMERLRTESHPAAKKVVASADQAANHPIFGAISSLENAQKYMEFQVWCVWDFMCLAKAVQGALGTFSVPWLPPKNGALLAAINEIIQGEETDTGPDGETASHFEIYLAAMRQAGANMKPITTFTSSLSRGVPWETALGQCGAPPAAIRFVGGTIRTALGPLPGAVASFCLGREELVPMMLDTMLRDLPQQPELELFRWYIQRHIELDSDTHGPLSSDLFDSIAGADPKTREEALTIAAWAISERTAYLDAIMENLSVNDPTELSLSTK
jgi:hypothetical protein